MRSTLDHLIRPVGRVTLRRWTRRQSARSTHQLSGPEAPPLTITIRSGKNAPIHVRPFDASPDRIMIHIDCVQPRSMARDFAAAHAIVRIVCTAAYSRAASRLGTGGSNGA